MSNSTSTDIQRERRKINQAAFFPGYIILLVFIGTGLANLDSFKAILDAGRNWLVTNSGWFNVFSALLIVLFTFGVAFSPIGNIRLGGKDAKPEYTIWQWFSMALCGCIGIGILFWAMGEPIFHLMQPPASIGLEPQTRETGVFAISQALLHWSVAQYCIYTICGVAVALVAYNMRYPLSVAAGLFPLFGPKARPAMSAVVHAICLFSLCCAIACSMGAGLLQIGSGIGFLFNINPGKLIWALVAVLIIALYTFSSTTGIKKGMCFLSSQCTKMFFGFMVFTLIVGPTLFILTIGTESFGYFLNNFFRNSVILNAMIPQDKWCDNWIIIFMASFFIYAPLLGVFLARLGRGRTVRQFILVNVLPPTTFCFVWISIFGGTAIHFQWSGLFDVWKSVQETGLESTIFTLFRQFPFSTFVIALFIVTIIISFATLADPMTSVLATLSTKGLQVEDEAPRPLKLLWGITAGTIAYLLVASGGVESLRGMLMIAGFPLMIVTCLLCASVIVTGLELVKSPNNFIDKSSEFHN